MGGACSHQQAAAPPVPRAVAPVETPAPAPVASKIESKEKAPVDQSVYFDFDSSLMRGDAQPVLQRLYEQAKSNPRSKIRIEGNCDERGTGEYNIALGSQRAEAARKYLISLGMPPSRIETVSLGSNRPRYQGHDEASWSKNRRDDLEVR
jgi:peptidoglycan-associated lipoprotein